MKKFFARIKNLSLKKKLIYGGVALVVIILLISLFSKGKGAQGETVTVTRGDIVSEVSVTGTVKPTKSLDLAFERSGRLTQIRVNVGDKVTEGQTLLSLDNGDLYAQLSQAQAQLASQQSRLDQYVIGSRPEELAIYENRVASARSKAQTDMQNTYTAALDGLRDAYVTANSAVRDQIGDLFNNDEDNDPKVVFNTLDANAKIQAGAARVQSRDELNAWSAELASLNPSDGAAVEAAVKKAKTHFIAFTSLFSNLQAALNSGAGEDTTLISGYKSAVASGRANITAAMTLVNKQDQLIASQKTANESNISAAQKDLDLKKAGSTNQDIQYQQAQVEQSQSSVAYYQSQLNKTILTAPFSGTITKIPFSKGEIVQPNAVAISLIGEGNYQVEAYITESDIAKVKLGDQARVTLDAYGQDVVFSAKVIHIDLSETKVEGVPTYKTTLEFTSSDERILPGLTANIDIMTDQRAQVLTLPTRNIITEDGKKYVNVVDEQNPKQFKKIEIKTGLRGSDGKTEILEGLAEGQVVSAE